MEREEHLKTVMLKASALMLAVMLAVKLLGYVFHIAFVRLFSQDSYGTYVYALSLGLFMCGLIPSISAAVARYVAYYRGGGDMKAVGSTILNGLVLTLLFAALASALAFAAYGVGLLPIGFNTFLFSVGVMCLNLLVFVFIGVISGYRKPEVNTYFTLLQQALRVAALFVVAAAAASFDSLLALQLFAFLLSSAIIAYYSLRKYGVGSGLDLKIGKELFRFGSYSVLQTTSYNMLSWTNILLLQSFLGAAVVGIYNIAWMASNVPLLLFLVVLQIFSPVAAELFGSGSRERLSRLASYLFEAFFLLFLPVFIAVTLFARELLTVFVPAEYLAGAVTMQVLSIGGFFFGLALLFVDMTTAEGRADINARNTGLAAAVNVALAWLLIPLYGIVGAAAAALISSMLLLALSYNHIRRVIPMTYSLRRLVGIVASSLLSVVVAWTVKALVDSTVLSLILSSAALALAYVASLLLTKSLRQEDVELAEAAMERFRVPVSASQAVLSALKRGVYSRISL